MRLTEQGHTQSGRSVERVRLEGSDYDTVLRTQELHRVPDGTTTVSLAAEIQHQLLPSESCCEAPQFTLAATLLAADTIAGDTYGYTWIARPSTCPSTRA